MLRSYGLRRVRSSPPSSMTPLLGSSKPAIIINVVQRLDQHAPGAEREDEAEVGVAADTGEDLEEPGRHLLDQEPRDVVPPAEIVNAAGQPIPRGAQLALVAEPDRDETHIRPMR